MIQTILYFRAEKFLCTFLSCTKHPFEGGRNIAQENDRAHLKTRGSFLTKSITRCTFLQHDSHMHLKSQRGIQKNCVSEFPVLSALKSPSSRLVVFIDMNTNILTEGRNFKTFLKENYAIALDSCCLFTKEILNMELNIILVVLLSLRTLEMPEICRFDEY